MGSELVSYADAKVQTEVVHFVPPPGWQPCSEHRLLHWTGDFIGVSAPYHHLLSVIGVSEGRTVLHNLLTVIQQWIIVMVQV